MAPISLHAPRRTPGGGPRARRARPSSRRRRRSSSRRRWRPSSRRRWRPSSRRRWRPSRPSWEGSAVVLVVVRPRGALLEGFGRRRVGGGAHLHAAGGAVWRRRRPRSESPRWRWTSREADDRRADSRSGSRRESILRRRAIRRRRRRPPPPPPQVGRWIVKLDETRATASTRLDPTSRRRHPWPSRPLTAALAAGVPPASVLLPAGAGAVAAVTPPVWWIYRRVQRCHHRLGRRVEIRTRARLLPATRSRRGFDSARDTARMSSCVCARAHVCPTSHEMPATPRRRGVSSCDLSLVASWRKSRADSSRSDAAPSISTAPHSSSHRKYTSSTARTMFPRRYPHSRSRNSDCISSGLSMGFETSSPPSTLSGRLPCRLPCRLPRRDEPEARSVTVAAAAAAVAVMSSLRRDARGGSGTGRRRARGRRRRGGASRGGAARTLFGTLGATRDSGVARGGRSGGCAR